MNKISAEDVVNPETGEVFVKAGEKISYEVAKNIQNAGINDSYSISRRWKSC